MMSRMKMLYQMHMEGISIEQISKETGIEERALKKLFHRYNKENKNDGIKR